MRRLAAGAVLLLLLTACSSVPKPATVRVRDAELARLDDGARHAFERESSAQAVNLYAQVLRRARALDDAEEVGNAAYNLAVCLVAAGRYDAAEGFLREAAIELARARANVADVLLVQARVAQLRGNAEATLRFAGEVFTHPFSNPGPGHRAEVALLRGDIACDRKQTDQARALWSEARALSRASPDATLVAGVERLGGRILLVERRYEIAAQAFDREAVARRDARQLHELARALGRAGEAWELAGKPLLAADRYFRAARSGLAQGGRDSARRWQQQAEQLAERAGDAQRARQARALGAEILPPEHAVAAER
ncbi:hypothetical protein LBMAG56_17800 [Verrucomicrobiota bacterium]|nr:hypothetical protein LBMAG56_17800 [Verrucomicrobiota bacterium]